MKIWPESLPVPDAVAGFLRGVGRPNPVFDLKLDQCALLVIDMQNDFILPGAPLEGWNCMAIVPKITELVLFFRAHGRPVIWTKHIHQLNDIGILAPMWPATGPDSPAKALVKGTPGVEIVADLPAPADDELVIEKHRYSAFYQTDLELNLRTMDVKTLLITGVNTDICCETTARDGFMRDFQIMSVADAQTAITRELHEAALISTLVAFGRVAETAQVIEELEQSVS
ncbi:MAG: cysteine hydrolase [Brevefilum sp.]|nr:cysteine hydrolase [Brevefilum sp.]